MAETDDTADAHRLGRLIHPFTVGDDEMRSPVDASWRLRPRSGPLSPVGRARLDLVHGLLTDEAMWASPRPGLVDEIARRIEEESAGVVLTEYPASAASRGNCATERSGDGWERVWPRSRVGKSPGRVRPWR